MSITEQSLTLTFRKWFAYVFEISIYATAYVAYSLWHVLRPCVCIHAFTTCVHAHCGMNTPKYQLIEYLHEKDLIYARGTLQAPARFVSAL